MANILILGGAGFLGKNLYKTLTLNGHDVTIYTRTSNDSERVREIFPETRVYLSDFKNENDWETLLEDKEVIFHLISDSTPSNVNVSSEFSNNVMPTISLLESMKKGKKKIIFFSSGGTVYGVPEQIPIDEKHPTNPISPYGIQKLCIEKLLEYYGRTYEVDYSILRISNPYGTYQNPKSMQGVIAVFLANILQGKHIEVWGDGSAVRDYIYVDDVMRACLCLLDYHGEHRIFNVGSGKGHSVNEIIDIIKVKLCSEIKVQYLPKRIQDVPVNILDTTLIRRELNWQPEYDLEKGIQRMIETWNPNRKEFCVE